MAEKDAEIAWTVRQATGQRIPLSTLTKYFLTESVAVQWELRCSDWHAWFALDSVLEKKTFYPRKLLEIFLSAFAIMAVSILKWGTTCRRLPTLNSQFIITSFWHLTNFSTACAQNNSSVTSSFMRYLRNILTNIFCFCLAT